jgi:predicted TIM-barrel fold metal-dependent hydrolase
MVVMVHTGMEHSAEIVGNEYSDPGRLAPVLDAGCRVVACHAGMGAFFDREDFFPHLVAMMRRYPNLYCDTAVLGSMFRWRNLPRMLQEPIVLSRTVHASDFPFPPNALVFWNRLPISATTRLVAESNLLERDLLLKQALGLPAAVFSRGYELLGLRSGPAA